jgi:hypothetical protein
LGVSRWSRPLKGRKTPHAYAGRARADRADAWCGRHPRHQPHAPTCRRPPHKGRRPRPSAQGQERPAHTPEPLKGRLRAGRTRADPCQGGRCMGRRMTRPRTRAAAMLPQHKGMGQGANQPTTPATPSSQKGVDAISQAYNRVVLFSVWVAGLSANHQSQVFSHLFTAPHPWKGFLVGGFWAGGFNPGAEAQTNRRKGPSQANTPFKPY